MKIAGLGGQLGSPRTLGDWPTSSCGLYYGVGWDNSHFESETFGQGNLQAPSRELEYVLPDPQNLNS